MSYFLISRYEGQADPEVLAFEDDAAAAFAELSRRERAKRRHDEVVLFKADSVEDIRRTHSRFFPEPAKEPLHVRSEEIRGALEAAQRELERIERLIA